MRCAAARWSGSEGNTVLGGVILLFILVVLIALLITPALRARRKQAETPPEAGPETPPHGVVVHKLDDHRKAKSATDDSQKS
jgi:hypothetical protein